MKEEVEDTRDEEEKGVEEEMKKDEEYEVEEYGEEEEWNPYGKKRNCGQKCKYAKYMLLTVKLNDIYIFKK